MFFFLINVDFYRRILYRVTNKCELIKKKSFIFILNDDSYFFSFFFLVQMFQKFS